MFRQGFKNLLSPSHSSLGMFCPAKLWYYDVSSLFLLVCLPGFIGNNKVLIFFGWQKPHYDISQIKASINVLQNLMERASQRQ